MAGESGWCWRNRVVSSASAACLLHRNLVIAADYLSFRSSSSKPKLGNLFFFPTEDANDPTSQSSSTLEIFLLLLSPQHSTRQSPPLPSRLLSPTLEPTTLPLGSGPGQDGEPSRGDAGLPAGVQGQANAPGLAKGAGRRRGRSPAATGNVAPGGGGRPPIQPPAPALGGWSPDGGSAAQPS
ncbi:hypothetical protein VTK73DRAFT_621 [Phialemonium thermophilum]|uniref:Uncharacterized protein n=1 Tax=Phialemonium thermophilum TaxID=223376 RepID=A0ABR3VUR9_9PEZI